MTVMRMDNVGWASPGFVDTEIGPRMGLEVFDGHGSEAV